MTSPADLRRGEIAAFLGVRPAPAALAFEPLPGVREEGLRRFPVRYLGADGDGVPAFLWVPEGEGPFAGVVVHHQHAGERHLGKSEVAGLAGEAAQAFGPVLARRGVVVIAPDAPAFEDRRPGARGTAPHPDDFLQHWNAVAYPLLRGDTLLRQVLEDAMRAVSVLVGLPQVDPSRIGLLGHSMGGNTVLFQTALDTRVAATCASGTGASFARRMARGTGIEMASAVPGLLARMELADLLACVPPRRLLVASASEDPYSEDAPEVVHAARDGLAPMEAARLESWHVPGGHALDAARSKRLVDWLAGALGA